MFGVESVMGHVKSTLSGTRGLPNQFIKCTLNIFNTRVVILIIKSLIILILGRHENKFVS